MQKLKITALVVNKIKAKIKMQSKNIGYLAKYIKCSERVLHHRFKNKKLTDHCINIICNQLNINSDFLFDETNKNLLE